MSQVNSAGNSVRTANLADAVKHLDGQTFRFDRQKCISDPGSPGESKFDVGDRTGATSFENVMFDDAAILSVKLHSERSPQVAPTETVSNPELPAARNNLTDRIEIEQLTGRTITHKAFLEQSRQLVELLQLKEKELVEREAGHHVRVWNFERHVQQQQKMITAGQQDLADRESHLQAFQFDLIELQNELIDSQLATRSIVTELDLAAADNDKTEALEGLRDEVVHRYDGLLRTWKRLYDQMCDTSQDVRQQRDVA